MAPDLIQIIRNVPGFYNGGWGGPEYTDWMDEQLSWKNSCYIGDWSYLWTATFKGPDAFDFLRGLTVYSFEDFAIGQAKHMINCNEQGKVVTEGIVLRLGEDEFCTQSIPTWWCGFQLQQGDHDIRMTRPSLFKYQVQGPTSIAVIEKACGESVRDVPFMYFTTIEIAGVDVLALRQGMSGEVGFELQGPMEYGPKVHAAIMEGAVMRVRPKAMTVAVIVAGLLPIFFGTGTGSEVMSRIAAPMIGGMITAPLLSLFVMPAIYLVWKGRSVASEHRDGESTSNKNQH